MKNSEYVKDRRRQRLSQIISLSYNHSEEKIRLEFKQLNDSIALGYNSEPANRLGTEEWLDDEILFAIEAVRAEREHKEARMKP